MDEVKAPERIWACDSGVWFTDDQGEPKEYVEYRRSDLHDDLVKAADALAEAAQVMMAQCEDGDGYTERAAINVDCAIAAYRKARGETQ